MIVQSVVEVHLAELLAQIAIGPRGLRRPLRRLLLHLIGLLRYRLARIHLLLHSSIMHHTLLSSLHMLCKLVLMLDGAALAHDVRWQGSAHHVWRLLRLWLLLLLLQHELLLGSQIERILLIALVPVSC